MRVPERISLVQDLSTRGLYMYRDMRVRITVITTRFAKVYTLLKAPEVIYLFLECMSPI
jgi:hypothetical protein